MPGPCGLTNWVRGKFSLHFLVPLRVFRTANSHGGFDWIMSTFTVVLRGGSPWGFRIKGGREFEESVTISKVSVFSYFFIFSIIRFRVLSSWLVDWMTRLLCANFWGMRLYRWIFVWLLYAALGMLAAMFTTDIIQ